MRLELDAVEIDEALTQYVGAKFDLSGQTIDIHLQGPRGERGASASITLTRKEAQKEEAPQPPKEGGLFKPGSSED